MDRPSGRKGADKTEFYARQWFASLAKFHQVKNPETWQFTEEDLIQFLRFKLSQNMPTWKRLLAVEGVIWYRNNVRCSPTPRLEMVRAKLQEMVTKEKEQKNEVLIEDVIGKIEEKLEVKSRKFEKSPLRSCTSRLSQRESLVNA